VLPQVEDYCREAVEQGADAMPLTFSAMARTLGVDRATLRTHFAEEIREAQQDQRRRATPTARGRERRAYADMLRDRDKQNETLSEQNRGLLARLALVEYNEKRLGLNPEELFVTPAMPDRRVSRAGRPRRSRASFTS
jgi:hypothetical protein